ncbi:MAG: hypothetical protein H6732_06475 [Alphaproteobacteria bacterium]|nr:hypothetical protein [Alphaproteobacteria bacterium]
MFETIRQFCEREKEVIVAIGTAATVIGPLGAMLVGIWSSWRTEAAGQTPERACIVLMASRNEPFRGEVLVGGRIARTDDHGRLEIAVEEVGGELRLLDRDGNHRGRARIPAERDVHCPLVVGELLEGERPARPAADGEFASTSTKPAAHPGLFP